MTAWLLDVNILIALVDSAHTHHTRAWKWFEQHGGDRWATCPITENGFVRVLADRKYPNLSLSPEQAVDLLARLKRAYSQTHEWWPDDISITDSSVFQTGVLLEARQITDTYLLGLANRKGGRLASFDRGLRFVGPLRSWPKCWNRWMELPVAAGGERSHAAFTKT